MIIKDCNFPSNDIVKEAINNGMTYFDLSNLGENRKYFVKSYGVVDSSPYVIIDAIHKDVCSIMRFLSSRREYLEQILPKNIVDVIIKRPGEISPLQRYDIIYDTYGDMKIIEVNSETPAGTPETINSYLFDKYIREDGIYNGNQFFEQSLINSFDKIGSDTVDVIFSDDSTTAFNKIGEDYTNSLYLSSIWNNCGKSRIVNVKDIEIHEEGLSAYGEHIKSIHSFYPLERLFMDDGGVRFWDLYARGKFDLINGPINLISQSKAFRAWVGENLGMLQLLGVIHSQELFIRFVPRYYFEKQRDIKTIAKPRLFREGVGIGDESLKGSVHQEYVEQKLFTVDTYEGEKQGYMTLGIYTNKEYSIGTYCRFCQNKVTDYTSYFLPIYNKIHEKALSISDVMNNARPNWLLK